MSGWQHGATHKCDPTLTVLKKDKRVHCNECVATALCSCTTLTHRQHLDRSRIEFSREICVLGLSFRSLLIGFRFPFTSVHLRAQNCGDGAV